MACAAAEPFGATNGIALAGGSSRRSILPLASRDAQAAVRRNVLARPSIPVACIATSSKYRLLLGLTSAEASLTGL